MNPLLVDEGLWVERHRPYLMLLALSHLDRRHTARLDSPPISSKEMDRTQAAVAGLLFRGLLALHDSLAK